MFKISVTISSILFCLHPSSAEAQPVPANQKDESPMCVSVGKALHQRAAQSAADTIRLKSSESKKDETPSDKELVDGILSYYEAYDKNAEYLADKVERRFGLAPTPDAVAKTYIGEREQAETAEAIKLLTQLDMGMLIDMAKRCLK